MIIDDDSEDNQLIRRLKEMPLTTDELKREIRRYKNGSRTSEIELKRHLERTFPGIIVEVIPDLPRKPGRVEKQIIVKDKNGRLVDIIFIDNDGNCDNVKM